MQRSTFDPQQTFGNSAPEALRATERQGTEEIDQSPTPERLFLEAGIVLAVALGAGLIVELVMRAA
jgi:hypothetical protein